MFRTDYHPVQSYYHSPQLMDQNLVVESICAVAVASDTLLSFGSLPHPRDIVDAAKAALVATAAIKQSQPIGHFCGIGDGAHFRSSPPSVSSLFTPPPSIYLGVACTVAV